MANLNKLKKYHFLYKTTNLLNGKFYVGIHSTSNLKDGYLGSGTQLRRSIRKYGIENFKLEILEFFENRELLVEREKELVNDELLKEPLCMNLKPGGSGGLSNNTHLAKFLSSGVERRMWLMINDEEWKHKWNEAVKIGIVKAIESGSRKQKPLPYDWTGKNHTEETKRKMSEVMQGKGIGKANSQFGTMWITNGTENKKIKKEEIIPTGWKRGRCIINLPVSHSGNCS
jgi:hypothetical protein